MERTISTGAIGEADLAQPLLLTPGMRATSTDSGFLRQNSMAFLDVPQ